MTRVAEPITVVPAAEAEDLVVRALTGRGCPDRPARMQAAHLVEADLRGLPSHGLQRVPNLTARLERGLLRGDAEPAGTWVTPSVIRVSGGRGAGPVVAHWTIERLLERARTTGVAVGLVADTNHLGMLAPYVERIAAADAVGIALTTSEALVHAHRGVRPLVGTNPLAIGIPAGPGTPVSLDMATGATSMGRIIGHALRGEPLEPGWAVDRDGRPTTDAVAARNGAISPFGGAKGYALGISLEVLVALLTGTALGTDVRGTLDAEQVSSKGDVLVCLSLEALQITDTGAVRRYLDEVRGAESVDDRPLDVPGDRARRCRAERQSHGIPYPTTVWQSVQELATADHRQERP